jgi:hypothetical protein
MFLRVGPQDKKGTFPIWFCEQKSEKILAALAIGGCVIKNIFVDVVL